MGEKTVEPGGYREYFRVAAPLILSMSGLSIMTFGDRVLLSWYSEAAAAAAVAAGSLSFALTCFFMGVCTYASAFLAQYYGAKEYMKIGKTLWQGLYLAIFGGLLCSSIVLFAPQIIGLFGHSPEMQALEVTYFRILLLGSVPFLMSVTLPTFYSCQGRTWPGVWVTMAMAVINLFVDYLLIFGNWGFPELGIAGAGIASVIASSTVVCIYLALIGQQKHRMKFGTYENMRPDPVQLKRMLKFGVPSGAQFFAITFGFSMFIMLTGQLDKEEFIASNILYQTVIFCGMPLFGLGMAMQILFGQYLGQQNLELANKIFGKASRVIILYTVVICMAMVFAPHWFLYPFSVGGSSDFDAIGLIIIDLYKLGAVYVFFANLNILPSVALKAAGDTHYVMWVTVFASVVILNLPSWLAIQIFDPTIYQMWVFCCLYSMTCSICNWARFRRGRWKSIKLISDSSETDSSESLESAKG